jgi:hypothetical protein
LLPEEVLPAVLVFSVCPLPAVWVEEELPAFVCAALNSVTYLHQHAQEVILSLRVIEQNMKNNCTNNKHIFKITHQQTQQTNLR